MSICRTLGVLPRDGGVLDQDPIMVRVLQEGLRAFAEVEKDEADKNQPKTTGKRRGRK